MYNLKERFKAEFKKNFKQILKAQLIIAAIVFVILLIGLSIMKIEHAFWIALGTAVVDLIPIIGSGVVLVPWAIYELFYMRDPKQALGLIILYVVITILHQTLEPVLRGKSLGLAFMPTVIASVVGYSLFNIPGLIFAPLIVSTTVNVYESVKDNILSLKDDAYDMIGMNKDLENDDNPDVIDVEAKIKTDDKENTEK